MPRIFFTLLFLSLILCACAPNSLTPETFPPTPSHDAATAISIVAAPNLEESGVSTEDPATSSYPQGCGYQWAQKALPELSSSFQQSMQTLQPEAQAYAFAFGEDCIHADGSATFIPMETDFNITLQVAGLSDEAAGEWVVNIMQFIEAIPPDQIVGPRPGRVGILFEISGKRDGVSFYIDQFKALPTGLSNAEIYQALHAQQ